MKSILFVCFTGSVFLTSGKFVDPLTTPQVLFHGSAIPPGEYNVINAVAGQRYSYYLEDVNGRSGIAIHGGTNSGHTAGCIIVGSGQSLQDFYEFIENNQGDGGVRIIIE